MVAQHLSCHDKGSRCLPRARRSDKENCRWVFVSIPPLFTVRCKVGTPHKMFHNLWSVSFTPMFQIGSPNTVVIEGYLMEIW